MSSYFYNTPSWLSGFQKNLNDVLPSAPNDALWGCIKSAGASHTITMVLTRGNAFSGFLSDPVGIAATIIHTIVLSAMKSLRENKIIEVSEERWRYVPPVATLSGMIGSYYFGKKIGITPNLWWTLAATAIPYAITQKHINNPDPTTPLFIIVVS